MEVGDEKIVAAIHMRFQDLLSQSHVNEIFKHFKNDANKYTYACVSYYKNMRILI